VAGGGAVHMPYPRGAIEGKNEEASSSWARTQSPGFATRQHLQQAAEKPCRPHQLGPLRAPQPPVQEQAQLHMAAGKQEALCHMPTPVHPQEASGYRPAGSAQLGKVYI
jgi:hypothetical protein